MCFTNGKPVLDSRMDYLCSNTRLKSSTVTGWHWSFWRGQTGWNAQDEPNLNWIPLWQASWARETKRPRGTTASSTWSRLSAGPVRTLRPLAATPCASQCLAQGPGRRVSTSWRSPTTLRATAGVTPPKVTGPRGILGASWLGSTVCPFIGKDQLPCVEALLWLCLIIYLK